MQSVVENLCRCFGTETPNNSHNRNLQTAWSDNQKQSKSSSSSTSATPDMKRRTRSLALKDKQWDALFEGHRNPKEKDFPIEQAQALAKAKLEAHRAKRHKRKRSPEHIFRSRESNCETGHICGDGGATAPNPFSRFLSRNPAFASSLCFATPVHGSNEEPGTLPLNDDNSVMSGGEDTITSTVYYEQVKLAGLQQKNPPMPLFNRFSVQDGDQLKQVVENETHSSAALEAWMKSNPSAVAPVADLGSESEDDMEYQDPDDVPPDMTKSSSTSSTARSV